MPFQQYKHTQEYFLGPETKDRVKIMYFDTLITWVIYKPMDRKKSLLLEITSFSITSSFPYRWRPLFLVTHKMALSFYL